MVVRLPDSAFWRRKEVLGLGGGGLVTKYDFERAVESGRLRGVVFPGRKYRKYEAAEVCTAFGLKRQEGGTVATVGS